LLMNILWGLMSLIFFCLVVMIHELGHFSMAKLFNIKVNEFAIGMGPKLLKFQKGETLYTLRALPIGGFCAMEGEDTESKHERSINRQSVWKRMIVISAGAIFNVILGFIFAFITLVQVQSYSTTSIEKFENNETSYSEFKSGDKIKSVNNYRTYMYKDIIFSTYIGKDDVKITLERDKKNIDITVKKESFFKDLKEKHIIFKSKQKNFINVITESAKLVVSEVRSTWRGLKALITGEISLNNLHGPVGIISEVSKSASTGNTNGGFALALNNVISIMTMITVNLGVMNMIPFPALDGGRFVFLVLEAIRRKPINPKYEGIVHTVGFILVLLLTALFTFGDISKLMGGK